MNRRQALAACATAAVSVPAWSWLAAPAPEAMTAFPLARTTEEWRARLSPAQYRVLRDHGTERAFTSPLDREKRAGRFVCAGCGRKVFDPKAKFDSGTGWPSFWEAVSGAVGTRIDTSWAMIRTEVHCANCGSHLGHLFNDGPPPSGRRYCINGVAMLFEPA